MGRGTSDTNQTGTTATRSKAEKEPVKALDGDGETDSSVASTTSKETVSSPSLKKSQIVTLDAVATHPGGYIRMVELAEIQGIKEAAAERKLRSLVKSGHLRRTSMRPYGPVYVLTELGKTAVQG